MKKILLPLSLIFSLNVFSQDCSELFISEYIEGPGNNNAIEIYASNKLASHTAASTKSASNDFDSNSNVIETDA